MFPFTEGIIEIQLVSEPFKCESCGIIAQQTTIKWKEKAGCLFLYAPIMFYTNYYLLCGNCGRKIKIADRHKISEIKRIIKLPHTRGWFKQYRPDLYFNSSMNCPNGHPMNPSARICCICGWIDESF